MNKESLLEADIKEIDIQKLKDTLKGIFSSDQIEKVAVAVIQYRKKEENQGLSKNDKILNAIFDNVLRV